MTIGERIKAARESKGINQSDLARTLGVKPQSVQQWESGITIPRPQRIEAVANALDVLPGWLMFGSGPMRTISIVSEPQQIYSVALDEQELHLVENFREMDSSQRDLLKKIGDTFKSR